MATSLPLSDSEQPLQAPEPQRTEEKPDSRRESVTDETNTASDVLPVLPPKPIGLDRSQVTVDEHGSSIDTPGPTPTVPPKPLSSLIKTLDKTRDKTSTGPKVAPSLRTKIYRNHSELLSSDTHLSYPTLSALRSQQPARFRPHTPPELVHAAADYESVQPADPDSLKKMTRSRKLEFKEIGKVMKLTEFCSQKKTLPCLIKITHGYTSLCERYSLGSDQLFVVIEMKEIDTVCVKSAKVQYDVAIQTDAFTVLPSVDPPYRRGQIIRPLELLKCEILPKVIQAASIITTVKGRKILSGTLLFPQEVKKKTKKLQKRLLVARLEDGSVVEISSECGGDFSADNKLSLSTAAKCIKLPFECTLKPGPLKDDIFCHSVTIESVRKELFLFGVMKVSDGSIQDDVNSFQQLSEIPGNLEISVVIMVPKDENVLEDIYESAHSYYSVKSMSKGSKKSPPSKIQYYSKSDVQTPLVSKSKKTARSRPLPRIPLATASNVSMGGPTPKYPSQVHDSANKIVAQFYNRHSTTGNTTNFSRQGTATIRSLDEILHYPTLSNSPDLTAAGNIRTLKSLDTVGVLNLLDAMNLSVYKENFKKELIDGEILSEFTEEMFIELGVESSLHRLRLMHVVKGRKDVSDI